LNIVEIGNKSMHYLLTFYRPYRIEARWDKHRIVLG